MIDRYDQNLLLGYVEGELSPDERARFEKDLADDPQLRRLLDQIVADRQALQSLPEEIAPPGLVDDALAQLERRMLLGEQDDAPLATARDGHARRYHLGKVIAYAGVAAVLALSFGLVFYSLNQTSLLNDLAQYAIVSESDEPEDAAQPAEMDALSRSQRSGDVTADEEMPLALAAPEAPPADADAPLSPGMNTLAQLRQIDAPPASPEPRPVDADGRGRLRGSRLGTEPAQPTPFLAESSLARADAFHLGAQASQAPLQSRIEIDTVDAEQTWQQVREWAMSNQVRIVDEPDPLPASAKLAQQQQTQMQNRLTATRDGAGRYNSDAYGEGDMLVRQRMQQGQQQQSTAVVTQRATLELSDEQMRELVERLNRDERQAARVQIASLPSNYHFGFDDGWGYASDGALPRGVVRSNGELPLPVIASNAMRPTYEQMAQAGESQRNEQAIEPSASPRSATAPEPESRGQSESLTAEATVAERRDSSVLEGTTSESETGAQRPRTSGNDGNTNLTGGFARERNDDAAAETAGPVVAGEPADDAVPSLSIGGDGHAAARAQAEPSREANDPAPVQERAAMADAPAASQPAEAESPGAPVSEPAAPAPQAEAVNGAGGLLDMRRGERALDAEARDAAPTGLSIDAPAPPSWSDWSIRLREQTPWAPSAPALPPRAMKQTVQIILRSPDAAAPGEVLREEQGAASEVAEPVERAEPAEPAPSE